MKKALELLVELIAVITVPILIVLGFAWLARWLSTSIAWIRLPQGISVWFSNGWLACAWLCIMLFYLLLMALMGTFSNAKMPLGLLVNAQNRLSFSRLQMVLWLVLVVATVSTLATARYYYPLTEEQQKELADCQLRNATDADKKIQCDLLIALQLGYGWLKIGIPPELLLAAGLSVGTATVAAYVNSAKRNPGVTVEANLQQQQDKMIALQRDLESNLTMPSSRATSNTQTAQLLQEQQDAQRLHMLHNQLRVLNTRAGALMQRDRPGDAQLGDMVSGNQVGNWEVLDWSKMQALVLTLLLVGFYAMAVWRMFFHADLWQAPAEVVLPAFEGGLLTLLTISLAGYVGNQSADHTQGQPPAPPVTEPGNEETRLSDKSKSRVHWTSGTIEKRDSKLFVRTYDGVSIYELDATPNPLKNGESIVFQLPTDSKSVPWADVIKI